MCGNALWSLRLLGDSVCVTWETRPDRGNGHGCGTLHRVPNDKPSSPPFWGSDSAVGVSVNKPPSATGLIQHWPKGQMPARLHDDRGKLPLHFGFHFIVSYLFVCLLIYLLHKVLNSYIYSFGKCQRLWRLAVIQCWDVKVKDTLRWCAVLTPQIEQQQLSHGGIYGKISVTHLMKRVAGRMRDKQLTGNGRWSSHTSCRGLALCRMRNVSVGTTFSIQ